MTVLPSGWVRAKSRNRPKICIAVSSMRSGGNLSIGNIDDMRPAQARCTRGIHVYEKRVPKRTEEVKLMANVALRKTNQPADSSVSPYSSSRNRLDPSHFFEGIFGWDPFREIYPMLGNTPSNFAPDFEVSETHDSYVIVGDLPGVDDSDVDLSLRGNQLTISGKREQEEKKESPNYFCCERSYGSFLRTFTLPQGVDQEHIRADLKNGVLTVTLPKSPEMKARKIALGAANPTGTGPTGKITHA
jgi:HSP20 family protein